jgi:hypothetical protein
VWQVLSDPGGGQEIKSDGSLGGTPAVAPRAQHSLTPAIRTREARFAESRSAICALLLAPKYKYSLADTAASAALNRQTRFTRFTRFICTKVHILTAETAGSATLDRQRSQEEKEKKAGAGGGGRGDASDADVVAHTAFAHGSPQVLNLLNFLHLLAL